MSWLVVLSAYPCLLLASLHGVWAWEWVINGEPPIPPHHGADCIGLAVLYWITALLLFASVPILGLTMYGLYVAAARAFIIQRKFSWQHELLAVVPLLMWLAAFLVLQWDPLGALYFYMD